MPPRITIFGEELERRTRTTADVGATRRPGKEQSRRKVVSCC